MSCIQCSGKSKTGEMGFFCQCDQFEHPIPLNIGANLKSLPRQIASFPEFRRAMLNTIHEQEIAYINSNNVEENNRPLVKWRARANDDLGIMLIEMWAYICDSLSFYDGVIANESYLKTSVLRPNLRKLVALLGYLPRPAIGSTVHLGAIAEGRLQVNLLVGTAFRSGAFNGNPPQVFELDYESAIHPFFNKFEIAAPHKGTVQSNHPISFLVNLKTELKNNDLVLVLNSFAASQNKAVTVNRVEKHIGADAKTYNKLIFNNNTKINYGTALNNIQVLKSSLFTKLWALNKKAETINGNKIILNTQINQIKAGEYVVITLNEEKRWYKIVVVREVLRNQLSNPNVTINGSVFNIPSAQIAVTELELDQTINATSRKAPGFPNWSENEVDSLVLNYGFQTAAVVIDEPNTQLLSTDSLHISNNIESPIENLVSKEFLLSDKNTFGVKIGGEVDFNQKQLFVNQATDWLKPLTLPVTAFGNVITASRGEKVWNEKLGSGNASLANQSFKLKKKPLTYLSAQDSSNDTGFKNTLTVYVNDIKWKEVKNFYGRNSNEQIYIVRQNDEGDSLITFGDGIRGQRLVTGIDNIIAHYRFGAEAACPPIGSVNQISKPVKGLKSVKNYTPAFGGADAETEQSLRKNAPKTALLLGRVVSMLDMEALTASYPGVRAVQTEWRWDKNKQKSAAHIYYIGDAGLRSNISQKIRGFADPTTPITVETALGIETTISINIQIDENYLDLAVISALRVSLFDIDNGLFALENIGIGKPLFRSELFEKILTIEGIISVQSILVNNGNFDNYAINPGSGHYFDVEIGGLTINGISN